ncbi:MAG TPA: GNAT family N-acetyltransferase [Acidimicrobiales bacterium]
MELENASITLQPMTLRDASAIGSDDRLGRLWAPDFPTDGDVRVASLVERGIISPATPSWPWGPYVVVDNESGCAIGGIGFKGGPDTDGDVEIGYGICRSEQRRGVASEAVRAMCGAARRHGARSVLAETDLDNWASQRVLEKCGFTREPDDDDLSQWRYSL